MYVDDIVILAPNPNAVTIAVMQLHNLYEARFSESVSWFLGLKFISDRNDVGKLTELTLLQLLYVESMLGRFWMKKAKPVLTPMVGAFWTSLAKTRHEDRL